MGSYKSKVFNICTRVKDDTGKEFINEFMITHVLDKYKSIKKWAWILHDKDDMVVLGEKEQACVNQIKDLEKKQKDKARKLETLDDEEMLVLRTAQETLKNNQAVFESERHIEPKPAHYHIVITCDTSFTAKQVAKWFGIPEQFVAIPKGNKRYLFIDCVEYLTHESLKEQQKGKFRYDDKEVHANFDFRTELTKRWTNTQLYADKTLAEELYIRVGRDGMTLKELESDYPEFYYKQLRKFKELRQEYIYRQPVPLFRINFYISGNSGIGKDIASRYLAKSLYKTLISPGADIEHMDDDEIFFFVGKGSVTFDKYDGQKILIWSDFRAQELIDALGNVGNLYNVFDTIPKKQQQHVKWGSTQLLNAINIVNGIQDQQEFCELITTKYVEEVEKKEYGDHEDINQVYRRFPFMLPLQENFFDLYVNKGFIEGTWEYGQSIHYGPIPGNFAKIKQKYGLSDRGDVIAYNMLGKTVEKGEESHKTLTKIADNLDELDDEFANYGKFDGEGEVVSLGKKDTKGFTSIDWSKEPNPFEDMMLVPKSVVEKVYPVSPYEKEKRAKNKD